MIVKLKDIGKIITGNTPSKKEESYWSSNDICFVKPDLISENDYDDLMYKNAERVFKLRIEE